MKRYPAFDPPEYVTWSPDPNWSKPFGRHWAGILTVPRSRIP